MLSSARSSLKVVSGPTSTSSSKSSPTTSTSLATPSPSTPSSLIAALLRLLVFASVLCRDRPGHDVSVQDAGLHGHDRVRRGDQQPLGARRGDHEPVGAACPS